MSQGRIWSVAPRDAPHDGGRCVPPRQIDLIEVDVAEESSLCLIVFGRRERADDGPRVEPDDVARPEERQRRARRVAGTGLSGIAQRHRQRDTRDRQFPRAAHPAA